jgi:ribA/ribD-fused uncharacterized protein
MNYVELLMSETYNSIFFYSHKGPFGYMSNFYSCSFNDKTGVSYNCSEQYLMYQKCLMFDPANTDLLNKIMTETDPKTIKKYGRMVRNYDENKWNKSRYDVMLDGLKLKFKQNNDILIKLKSTHPKKLYEASKYDNIWGIGYTDKEALITDESKYGLNILGRALEEIRLYL